MSDFWNNIFRYPRFFVSSTVGLILVIFAPFRSLFKVPKLRVFLTIFSLFFLVFLYVVIQNMLGF